MKKIIYPDNIGSLLIQYVSIFPIRDKQKVWNGIRNDMRSVCTETDLFDSIYPTSIEDILIADYPKLVDIYIDYFNERKRGIISEDIEARLQELFNYNGDYPMKYQPDIANFFMQNAETLNIHVCHYCELSYVNAYGLKNKYGSFLEFLNNADDKEIKRHIRGSNGNALSDKTYTKIISLRNQGFQDDRQLEEKFNAIHPTWKQGKGKCHDVMNKLHNHFDLDHFLPKSKCPIVGLSFKNFVPSCSVCNEKLKKDDMLGQLIREDLLRLSPTSSEYCFDEKVKITIQDAKEGVNHLKMQEHASDFKIIFETDDELLRTEIIDEFRLEERYNYHKCEALRLHDLLLDYPDAKIKKMSEALGNSRSVDEIKEDIFGMNYSKDNHRCMDKMRRDVLSLEIKK